MTAAEKTYDKLFQLSRTISSMQSILSLLQWDQETYMPSGGSAFRAEEIELLSGLIHKEKTSKAYGLLIEKLVKESDSLDPAKQAAVRQWAHDWKKDSALPHSFVTKFSKLCSTSLHVWQRAKKENNFSLFAPYLAEVIEMNREKAGYLGWKEHPYDALIDLYEEGVTTKEITKLFDQIKVPVHALLQTILKKKPTKDSFLYGRFSDSKQIAFGKKILTDMGYDFHHGRIDFSSHPFSESINPEDNRITTRLHPSWIVSNILVLIHEAGHSLYSMGLPKEQFGSPLGEAISMGMHECQSRFWETRIGQSKPFWKRYLPLLKETFPGKFDGVSLDAFYKAINLVKPSLIRVDADEVTYPLHVILRFEMEKALIEGSLSVHDVPKMWNQKMTELIGITPKDDREGCLQDIHWAMGSFGYFPTYSLGTIYASHLFEAFEKQNPDWDSRVAKGDMLFIKDWLHKNVYQYGRRYSSLELLKKVTGKKLTSDAYLEYLATKYLQ